MLSRDQLLAIAIGAGLLFAMSRIGRTVPLVEETRATGSFFGAAEPEGNGEPAARAPRTFLDRISGQ